MNHVIYQVLLYKNSPEAKADEPRSFFVRKKEDRHGDVKKAHRDSMQYEQTNFKNAKKLHPEFTCYDSIEISKVRRSIIEYFELLGFVCLNVQRNRKS